MVKASVIRIAYLNFFWTFHKPGFNSRDFRKNPTSGIILRLYFSSSRKSTFLLNTFAFVERWAYCHNDSLSYPKFTVVVFLWFYPKILKLFCPLKPWNMFQFHQFIIHRVFFSCNQKMIFIYKLLSSIFYQEKVQIISGQNLAIPVTVIWWNRNPSWKKECQMKFDRQRTPVISGKHDWSYTMGSKKYLKLHSYFYPPTFSPLLDEKWPNPTSVYFEAISYHLMSWT